MLRAIFVGLLSIGCAGEAYTTAASDKACDWAVVMLISFDEDAGDCSWSIRTLDDGIVRLRSVDGEPTEPVHSCEVVTYRRVEALRPTDSVEAWAPEDLDRAAVWANIEQSHCL